MNEKEFEQIGTSECVEEVNRLGLEDPETKDHFEQKPFTRHDLYNLQRKQVINFTRIKRGYINQYLYTRRDARLIYLAMKHRATGKYTIEGAFSEARDELGFLPEEEAMEELKGVLATEGISAEDGYIPITPQTAEYLLRKIKNK